MAKLSRQYSKAHMKSKTSLVRVQMLMVYTENIYWYSLPHGYLCPEDYSPTEINLIQLYTQATTLPPNYLSIQDPARAKVLSSV